MLEALACNMPIVTHDDENRRWSIGEAGILVDVTDVNKFAKALYDASNTDWGDIPRKQAERFSWERTVDKYEREIISILS